MTWLNCWLLNGFHRHFNLEVKMYSNYTRNTLTCALIIFVFLILAVTSNTSGAASVGDFVWQDTNGNGMQDQGEPGIGGVTLNLLNRSGQFLSETITNEFGEYKFDGLVAGTYIVTIHATKSIFNGPLYGMVPSPRDAGDDRYDSDIYTKGWWNTPGFKVEENEYVDNVDFGFYDPPVPTEQICFYSIDYWQTNVANIVNEQPAQFTPQQLDDYILAIKGLTPIFGPPSFEKQLDLDLADQILNPRRGFLSKEQAWQKTLALWLNYVANGGHEYFNYLITDCSDSDPVILGKAMSMVEAWLFEGGYYWIGTISTQATGISYFQANKLADCLLANLNCDAPPEPCENCSSIGNLVWKDIDRDGVQDEAEPGIEGVTVMLLDGYGMYVTDTVTDELGKYKFEDLAIGTYIVGIHATKSIFTGPLNGLIPSPQNATHDSYDSDVYRKGWWVTTGNKVEDTEFNETVDFGFYEPKTPPTELCFNSLEYWQLNVNQIYNGQTADISEQELIDYIDKIKELTPIFGPPEFSKHLDVELANIILHPEGPALSEKQMAWQRMLAVWLNVVANGDFDIFSYVIEGCTEESVIFAKIITIIEAWLFEHGNYWFGTVETEAHGIRYDLAIELADCLLTVLNCDGPPTMDFGDAPDMNYLTLLGSDGARHIIVPGFYLGSRVDAEPSGQPDQNALGDDIDSIYPPSSDDEDGVIFLSPFISGATVNVAVSAFSSGLLNVWIDYNSDGDWADPGEQVFVDKSLIAGVNYLNITIPEDVTTFETFARFRFSSVGGLSYNGLANDGEVEDYKIFFQQGQMGSCNECDGKVTALTLVYFGDTQANIKVDTKKGVVYNQTVQPGQQFFFEGEDKNGELGKEIEFYVNGMLNTTLHTSCSKPIYIGMVFGDFKITDGYSLDGGKLCPIDVTDDLCDTNLKPVRLAFKYTAQNCSATSHSQDANKVVCSGDDILPELVYIKVTDKSDPLDDGARVYYRGAVSLDEVFIIDAAWADENELSSEMNIHIFDCTTQNVVQHVAFHTSCSQPLLLGDQFGSVQLIAFNPHPSEYPPITTDDDLCDDFYGGEDQCDSGEKPSILAMKYTGENCNVSSHSQDGDKVNCSGDEHLPENVKIRVSDEDDPDDKKAKIFFEGAATIGDIFLIDSQNAGEDKLESKTFVYIFDCATGRLVQSVEFHTSCSQPLLLGDQFGCLELIDFNPPPTAYPPPEGGNSGSTVQIPGDAEYQVYPNYPNPFNPSTEIRFDLKKADDVSITVYNTLGQVVRLLATYRFDAGHHNVSWNSRDSNGNPVPGGVYLYVIQGNGFREIRKMTLVK